MSDLKFIGKDSNDSRFYECPFCSAEIKVEGNSFWGQCPACKASLIDYAPAPYQMKFHQSKAQYRLNIGGFGSGKTTMCCAELASHVLSVPNGKSLITAPKLQQVRDAVIPELEKFLPTHLIAKKVVSPNIYYKMTNGHEILVYASNDEENLRSLNLTAFYIEEASNVDYKVFTQLQARLRNKAAVIYDDFGNEIDYAFMGLVSTNPDDGWVRSEFLLRSGKIFTSASLDRKIYDQIRVKTPEQEYHSFLSSSRDNSHLPKRFITTLCIGKTSSWIRKYIDCYLDAKEGAVYPDFNSALVEPFAVPKRWLRMVGFDKGWRDETAATVGAIDPKTAIIYINEEYYVKEQPISYHAEHIVKMLEGYELYRSIQADPTVRNRTDLEGETYASYFLQKSGLYLEPGNNNIMAGIEKVRDYIYTGKLKIFNNLENLKDEAGKYVYQETKELPVDKHNHLLDTLRYLVAALPDNPLDFTTALFQNKEVQNFWSDDWNTEDGVYNSGGVYLTQGGLLND